MYYNIIIYYMYYNIIYILYVQCIYTILLLRSVIAMFSDYFCFLLFTTIIITIIIITGLFEDEVMFNPGFG